MHFNGTIGVLLLELFNIGSDQSRFDIGKLNSVRLTPIAKEPHRSEIRLTSIAVADIGGEKLDKTSLCVVASELDQFRNIDTRSDGVTDTELTPMEIDRLMIHHKEKEMTGSEDVALRT
jgi:hypothetical protein